MALIIAYILMLIFFTVMAVYNIFKKNKALAFIDVLIVACFAASIVYQYVTDTMQ